jgi:DNA-binding response OmpR family regulator
MRGNVMVVDDSASNLKLLERVLVEQGLSVRTFLRGAAALAAAKQEPPDLFLLDINMPEMSGYEVCERLKADGPLSGIPVIFLSALSGGEDRVKGFRVGAVDYIPKPFEIREVQARVETHLKLRRAQQVERELLERTLGGAVTALWELVQLTSPVLALRSRAIREIVCWIATRVPTRDPWQCELAATLCLVGCITLPDEVFERGYAGQDLSPDEAQMFRAHPERAARLLSGIPRLEVVAEIIRNQQSSEKDLAAMTTSEFQAVRHAKQGAYILHLALELDRRIHQGVGYRSAVAQLRSLGRFDGAILDALDSYSPTPPNFEVLHLPIGQIRAGMVLAEDVWTNDGRLLILKKGTDLTPTWIERLENFAKARGLQQRLCVRNPRPTGLGSLSKPGHRQSGPGP